MKRTVVAFAAGLVPALAVAPSTAAAWERSDAVVEPAGDESGEPAAAPADAEPDPAGTADGQATVAAPSAPHAPTPPPDADAKGKRRGKGKGGLAIGRRGPKAEADGSTWRERRAARRAVKPEDVDRDDQKGYEKAVALQRPWHRRWEAKRNLVELGIYGGLLRPSDEHDLYDPRTRPQDPLWRLGADVGLRAAYFPLRPLGVEAEFSANPTRVRTITNDFAFVYGFRSHVILQVPVTRIVPFLLGGYGLMGVRSNILILGNDVDPAFHYGGGVKMFVTQRLVARIEARQIVSASATKQDSGTSHFQALAGLSFVLGRKKPVRPAYVEPADPDRDKDGFLNEADECPDIAGVGPTGCPDTDGDGFIDKVDACPEVPGVEPDGCPLKDSDDDKILDIDDDCPFVKETYNGIDDEDGCPDELPPELVTFKGALPGIEFDFGKDTIRPVSRPVLDDAIAKLQKFPGVRVSIVGHTDNVGDPESNMDLSRRRAAAVKQYLVDGGVDASRVETDGKGDTEPAFPNDTEENRAKNRRIVFQIINNEPTEVRPHSDVTEDPDAHVQPSDGGETTEPAPQ